MKNLDIDKLSKRMPYGELGDDYFAALEHKTLAKLNSQGTLAECDTTLRSKRATRRIATFATLSLTVAAAIAMVINIWSVDDVTPPSSEEQITDFVANLSDSELELIVDDAESSYEFYTNL